MPRAGRPTNSPDGRRAPATQAGHDRNALLAIPTAAMKPDRKLIYQLRVRCANCLHVWMQDVRRTRLWQDAVNMHDVASVRVPARVGKYCDRFHNTLGDEGGAGVFCEECDFEGVTCPHCDSSNLHKEPVPKSGLRKKFDVTHVVGYEIRNGASASTAKLERALELQIEAGNNIWKVIPMGLSNIIIIGYQDIPE